MELRDYAKIALRWWWLIVLPPLVIGLYGLATYRPAGQVYASSMRYTASQPAGLPETSGYDPNYYRWLTSEYIVTALKDWVRTGEFASAVSAELVGRGQAVDPGALAGALGADNARSVLVVTLAWPDPQQAMAVLQAVTAVLQNQNAAVFPQLGGLAAQVVPLDQPAVGAVPPSLRSRLDLPLKVGLGLAAGLGLALAAHYLDPFVRDRRELEAIGLRVIGEVPWDKKSEVGGQRLEVRNKPRLPTSDV